MIVVINQNLDCCNRFHNHKILSMQQSNIDVEKTDYKMTSFSCLVSEGVPLPLDNDRGGHVGGIVENRIIVAGGTRWSKDKEVKYFLNTSMVFMDSNWVKGPSLPIPMAYSMFASNSFCLYVAGGTSDGVSMINKVFVLKSIHKNARWEELPDLPEALGFGTAAIFNDIFYVCGGILNNGERTNRMWMLDLNDIESGWSESKPIPGIPRNLHTMVVCGSNLYVMGGLGKDSPLSPLDDVYEFDPDKNSWERLNDLAVKGYAWIAQPIDDTNILITGRADGQVHRDIWIIDLRIMSMSKVANLINPSTTAPLIKMGKNQWWLVGGEPDSNRNRTNRVNIINIIDNENENKNY